MVQQKDKTKMVSVIIPAYNEENTIENVVSIASKNENINEVIVVDDGSEDSTFKKAEKAGAKAIRLPQNKGKATAMNHGVANAKNNTLCFLDADIENISQEVLNQLISPVISNGYDMFVGICGRQRYKLNKLLLFLPVLGGQRAMKRKIWDQVPQAYKQDFKIEIALNYYTKINDQKMGIQVFNELDHTTKEKKYGLITGFFARLRMYYDVVTVGLTLYIYETLKRKVNPFYD